jgi:hypothetical protein
MAATDAALAAMPDALAAPCALSDDAVSESSASPSTAAAELVALDEAADMVGGALETSAAAAIAALATAAIPGASAETPESGESPSVVFPVSAAAEPAFRTVSRAASRACAVAAGGGVDPFHPVAAVFPATAAADADACPVVAAGSPNKFLNAPVCGDTPASDSAPAPGDAVPGAEVTPVSSKVTEAVGSAVRPVICVAADANALTVPSSEPAPSADPPEVAFVDAAV